jgi:large conductance mechanosensitive channel
MAEIQGVRTKRKTSKHVTGFADFLREYGVVGLAVGFVFGAQVKSVVDQLTSSFLNPILGLLLPGNGAGLNQKTFTVHADGKTQIFAWGAFVDTLISFVLIAIIIYFVIKLFKLERLKAS